MIIKGSAMSQEDTTDKFEIEIGGIVDSLKLNDTEGYLPVFEAVINSLQSIQETGNIKSGKIIVTVLRDNSQQTINSERGNLPIIGFEIIDNGQGFTDNNFNSFRTAYTCQKKEKGCKGIGRFLWLKVFNNVQITSVYIRDDGKYERSFKFTRNGFQDLKNIKVDDEREVKTKVTLEDIDKIYREKNNAFKKTDTIAKRVFEHCLSYYIYDSAPEIIIKDLDHIEDNKTINLNDLYDHVKPYVKTKDFTVKKHSFTINHVRLYDSSNDMNNIVYCANHREVIQESPEKILGSKKLTEGDKEYVYAAYISGEYLDNNVDLTRTGFTIEIPQQRNISSFSIDLTLDEIRKEVNKEIKSELGTAVENVDKIKRARLKKYLKESGLTLASVIKYCEKEILEEMTPTISDDKLSEIVYLKKMVFDKELNEETHKILERKNQILLTIDADIPEIVNKIRAARKDDLASYILHRKYILEYMQNSLKLNDDKKYEWEAVIHDAIFPRGTTSDDISQFAQNLWLIDERFTFYRYATSNKTVDNVKNGDDNDGKSDALRPDVVIYTDASDDTAKSVVIIELKRPQTEDGNIVNQLFDYVDLITNTDKNKRIKTEPGGRPILTDLTTQFYCYGICDITTKIINEMNNRNFSPLPGEMGYYTFNAGKRTHMEILAYDKVIPDAKKRNKVFFEVLEKGLDI